MATPVARATRSAAYALSAKAPSMKGKERCKPLSSGKCSGGLAMQRYRLRHSSCRQTGDACRYDAIRWRPTVRHTPLRCVRVRYPCTSCDYRTVSRSAAPGARDDELSDEHATLPDDLTAEIGSRHIITDAIGLLLGAERQKPSRAPFAEPSSARERRALTGRHLPGASIGRARPKSKCRVSALETASEPAGPTPYHSITNLRYLRG
jgi:hypothetical protein